MPGSFDCCSQNSIFCFFWFDGTYDFHLLIRLYGHQHGKLENEQRKLLSYNV